MTKRLPLKTDRTSLPFWELLSDAKKVELAQKFKLPVVIAETPYGTEIRLKGLYYGDEENFEKEMRKGRGA